MRIPRIVSGQNRFGSSTHKSKNTPRNNSLSFTHNTRAPRYVFALTPQMPSPQMYIPETPLPLLRSMRRRFGGFFLGVNLSPTDEISNCRRQ